MNRFQGAEPLGGVWGKAPRLPEFKRLPCRSRQRCLTSAGSLASCAVQGRIEMSALDDCYNVFDLRDAAKRKLPKAMFEFVDRSTEDEIALRNNRAAFERIRLRHRALVAVSGRPTKTTLFGK